MKFIIGNKIYTKEDSPLILYLTPKDKENIHNMEDDCTLYMEYTELSEEEALNLLNQFKEKV